MSQRIECQAGQELVFVGESGRTFALNILSVDRKAVEFTAQPAVILGQRSVNRGSIARGGCLSLQGRGLVLWNGSFLTLQSQSFSLATQPVVS